MVHTKQPLSAILHLAVVADGPNRDTEPPLSATPHFTLVVEGHDLSHSVCQGGYWSPDGADVMTCTE